MACRLGASLYALPRRGHRGPQVWAPLGTDSSEEGRLANWRGVSFRATPKAHRHCLTGDGLGSLALRASGGIGQLHPALESLAPSGDDVLQTRPDSPGFSGKISRH
jgi:hypothetical protein